MLLQRPDILRTHLDWMLPCFIRWLEVPEDEGCRQGLQFSHLHSVSLCRQTSCVSQAYPSHHAGLLPRAQRGSLHQPCRSFLDSSKSASGIAIGGPLGLQRTLQAQGSRELSHLIRLGLYKGVRVLARSVVLNHHLTISNNLRFHFSVSAFLQLKATYPSSYEFRL